MNTRPLIIVIILLAVITSACSSTASAKIEVKEPWVRAAAMMQASMAQSTPQGGGNMGHTEISGETMGSNSAAYMVITNSGGEADRLLSATSDVASAVEIHISEMKDGVMTMHPVTAIDIPAGGKAELKPGGYHVMLIGIKHDLKAGDKVQLTLNFEKSGQVAVEAEIHNP